jgi:hypothetical protein
LKSVSNVAKPAYLGSYTDPVFGTRITRITGDVGRTIPIVGGTWPDVARQGYSKRPVWNADQSLMVLERVGGWLLLDGETYRPLKRLKGSPGDGRWHSTLPQIMSYVSSNCDVGQWNVVTGAVVKMVGNAGYSKCSLNGEGNFSADHNRVAVSAVRRSDGKAVAFAYDLQSKAKFPDIVLADKGVRSLDWVSISPSGDMIVINADMQGGARGDETKIFTLNGQQVGSTWAEYGTPSHYDLTYDMAGNQVAVGVAKTRPHDGKIIMRRLTDGAITPLTVGGYASHTSARNLDLPGWAFVTHAGANPKWPPYRNEAFAVKLDGSMTIRRLAQLHDKVTDYESEGFVVPSPDGTRVVFSSNWGSNSGRPVQTYVVDYRGLCGQM